MLTYPEVEDRHHEVPERSHIQRMAALQTANEVRTYRADLKRDIKAGRKRVSKLLLTPPEEIETMQVFDLLLQIPKIGRTKANKMFRTAKMSHSKTVGGISSRQRDELIALLAGA